MIHKRVTDRIQKATEAYNRLLKRFPYIKQNEEGYEDRKQVTLDFEAIWAVAVVLQDELSLRDNRLNTMQEVFDDLIKNCPEARAYYQNQMDMGRKYIDGLQYFNDKEPVVRY